MSQQGKKIQKALAASALFFRCFGSHFGNLARHFKVGISNVIYYSVHVNTPVIKSAVHCLQLSVNYHDNMRNFVRPFPLADKSLHLIQFYPGFIFPFAFRSNNNLHDLYFLPIAPCCFLQPHLRACSVEL